MEFSATSARKIKNVSTMNFQCYCFNSSHLFIFHEKGVSLSLTHDSNDTRVSACHETLLIGTDTQLTSVYNSFILLKVDFKCQVIPITRGAVRWLNMQSAVRMLINLQVLALQ